MDNLKLDPAEQAQLSELGEVFNTVHSAGWKRIHALLEELVEEAHEDMFGALGTLEDRGVLTLRWQQREAMKRAVENYISDCISKRANILDEIARREEEARRAEHGLPPSWAEETEDISVPYAQ